jgi:isoquinoline 1-oxidoreductase beta subunit
LAPAGAREDHGAAVFALDIRRPGMLTVVVRHPDVFGATIASA